MDRGHRGHPRRRPRRHLVLHRLLFGRTAGQHADSRPQVLDRPDALAGRPGHVDPVRQVAEDRDAEAPALLLGLVEDLARHQGRLDEVGAEIVLLAHRGHRGGAGTGIEGGQHGAGHGQQPGRARGHQRARRAVLQHPRRPGHLPETRDAVGQHEIEAAGRIPGAERMGVHVGEARHQVPAGRVDDLCGRRHVPVVAGRLHADDPLTGDADVLAGPERSVAGIHHRDPADHQLRVRCHSSPPTLVRSMPSNICDNSSRRYDGSRQRRQRWGKRGNGWTRLWRRFGRSSRAPSSSRS